MSAVPPKTSPLINTARAASLSNPIGSAAHYLSSIYALPPCLASSAARFGSHRAWSAAAVAMLEVLASCPRPVAELHVEVKKLPEPFPCSFSFSVFSPSPPKVVGRISPSAAEPCLKVMKPQYSLSLSFGLCCSHIAAVHGATGSEPCMRCRGSSC